MGKYIPKKDEIFHVHTYRCGHAGDTGDREYVDRAIELGASRIVFTDHAPFPGNPFGNRMDIDTLPEYISSIGDLKERYRGQIEILCGLEIEYLPSFKAYYDELKNTAGLDLLLLGQHFYEHEPGVYSFSDENKSKAYIGICDAMAQGIKTGYFDVVAHPDRAFRKRKKWGEEEQAAAMMVIEAANESSVYLEKNYSSMQTDGYYRPAFWELYGNESKTIYGLDAHSLQELEDGWNTLKDMTKA